MPSWRCPHCATPQPEASRCWVCHRSSTSCGTCRHYRGSVAGRLGFCGLDRKREPLRGDEVRACWEDGAVPVAPDPVTPGLLDLLTAAAIGEPAQAEPGGRRPRPFGPDIDDLPDRPDTAVPPRFAPSTFSGSRRLWVEVGVGAGPGVDAER